MANSKSNVTHIWNRRPQAGLEALERLTGLRWGRMPQSLIHRGADRDSSAENELGRVLRLYSA